MIDESKMRALNKPTELPQDLEGVLSNLPKKDLRRLKSMVDSLLPSQRVKDLDLEDELMQQYEKTKSLMDDCIDDDETSPNQKAQVANSVVNTLGQLVKLQEDLRMQQTLKIMEQALIDTIKGLPKELKDEFFEEYERRAKKAGLMN
jgi:hypothetical protein